jgi:CheY-like chemotaxis protein
MTDRPLRGHVLVVDDHPVNRLLLEHVLELEQLEVLGAGSIAEAERVLEETVPPVIVLDLQLPDGHGLDLARRLKADPHTSGCAIVACTAARIAGEEQLARAVGCEGYVTKPIDTRRFASLVRSLMP